jgi:TatD DNase family protein
MILTDTHCHLDFHKFDEDRGAVIERAEKAGLAGILIPALSVTSSLSAIKLAESHPMLYAAIGVQPNESLTWTENTIEELRALVRPHPSKGSGQRPQPLSLRERETLLPSHFGGGAGGEGKIVAIGEIGLDYYWEAAPHDHQQLVFRAQLDLAVELGLPVVIHLREKDDADHGPCAEDAMSILEEWVAGLGAEKEALVKNPGVLHSFSGNLETAQRAIGINFCIGITGPVTFKNAKRKQEMVAQLPLEHLLIETDAPYLAPHPHRGKRNEPAFVYEIADKIAQLQSRSQEEVATITTKNAARLFSWGDVV